MGNKNQKNIREELDIFCRGQSILLAVMIIINSIICIGIIVCYRLKEQALIGYSYINDAELGKTIADNFFNFKINKINVSAGADALENAGYGRNGFLYISRINGELTVFVIVLSVLAALFIFGVIAGVSLKNKPAYVHALDLVNENKSLKSELENEKNYSEKQYKKMQDFIENIAHQIKTPLSAIAMKFDMLGEQLASESGSDVYHYIDMVKAGLDNTFKIKSFIKSLLAVSRLESGKVIMAEDEVEIDSLLIESINNSECQKNAIITDFNDGSTTIYADEGWLIEGFVNIINNCNEAVKSLENGKIYIDISSDKGNNSCTVTISDNGRGLTAEEFNKIFDRFETVASPAEFRFGIGMNLSKLIIESHSGSIKAGNSEKYGGAEFKIELPVMKLKSKIKTPYM
jgi:signal transduction histidine kinase